MYFLSEKIEFPDLSLASKEGLLAIGGDLSVERLILAYEKGIFPWYNSDEPILWWSPDPRFVLFPEKLKVSKSMQQFFNSKKFNLNYNITINQAFEKVITECSQISRENQFSTWITKEMKSAYIQLHRLGYAKSVEIWENDKLVAGFYGVDLGNGVFCGESMFTKVSNASKAAFIWFVHNSNYKLIDCQVYTSHLASLGAEEIPREEFLKFL